MTIQAFNYKFEPVKIPEVHSFEMGLYPQAECTQKGCGARPMANGQGVAKKWAKEHAARTGHPVLVEQITRTTYEVPDYVKADQKRAQFEKWQQERGASS